MQQHRKWTLDTIPWRDIRRERVADSDELFYMVATASFIEITSDFYTRNLVEHFAGDDEVSSWLANQWEPEELQHGAALREYVHRAWPDFDWQKHYDAFQAEYTRTCPPETLLPERSLEMASRCVVEMGTSCYYTALHHASEEPVLRMITQNIYQDEVGHYKYFYRYFRRYRESERTSRAQVAATLWRRLKIIDHEDTYISLKHVYGWRRPGQAYDRSVYKREIGRCRQVAKQYFPHHLSAGMLLKPLDIPRPAMRVAMPVLQSVTRLAMR
jgi:hypothetical protein